jgi:hypothetical protein
MTRAGFEPTISTSERPLGPADTSWKYRVTDDRKWIHFIITIYDVRVNRKLIK